MKKRILVFLLTLALCLSLGVPALAASGFRDVVENAWYLPYLDTAVGSGLINGRGDGIFAPNDSITGAEAVKLAACLGQLLSDGSVTLTNGSPWYASYMTYAVEHGILDEPFDQYGVRAPISRASLMDMFCRAIPENQRQEINSIPTAPFPTSLRPPITPATSTPSTGWASSPAPAPGAPACPTRTSAAPRWRPWWPAW